METTLENLANGQALQSLFSVAVAAYLLLRLEKRITALTEAINLLRHCPTCRLSPFEPRTLEDE